MRTKIPKLTDVEKESLKQRRLEHTASLTMAYQLGVYVGEYIVDKFLPTLSIDSIHTNTNISVTCVEGDTCRRLTDVWFEKSHGKESSIEAWQDLMTHRRKMEDKYLPKTVECHIAPLNIKEVDITEFKNGLIATLWNCDCSHYSTNPEDILIDMETESYFTVITLHKGKST